MKKIIFPLTFLALACNQTPKNSEVTVEEPVVETIDVAAEVDAINELRASFQQAIKEKRYSDLGQYATEDMKGVSPGSEDWLEYKKQREARMGKFSYDSIIMTPEETIIASDSIAYDYGTSKVYYTNDKGESVELQDTFIVILKKDKEDNKWRIHREVASAIVE
ncbi:YybH family protein [Flagellimonas iocasae]|uniref:YybH family protein n=1 Tax=Flagellimonas iocasae TaxID=2055905 RepID=A0ABW4XT42_9FLAO